MSWLRYITQRPLDALLSLNLHTSAHKPGRKPEYKMPPANMQFKTYKQPRVFREMENEAFNFEVCFSSFANEEMTGRWGQEGWREAEVQQMRKADQGLIQ